MNAIVVARCFFRGLFGLELRKTVPGRRNWVVTMAARPAFFPGLSTNAPGGRNDDDHSFYTRRGKEGKWPKYLCKFRYPKCTMKEEQGSVTYRFEVPGCGMKDFKVTVEDHKLIIINLKIKASGTEDDQKDDAGLMLMLLVWPCWFKPNSITTVVQLGILTVVVPKAEGKCFGESDRWWSMAWQKIGMLADMEATILGAGTRAEGTGV